LNIGYYLVFTFINRWLDFSTGLFLRVWSLGMFWFLCAYYRTSKNGNWLAGDSSLSESMISILWSSQSLLFLEVYLSKRSLCLLENGSGDLKVSIWVGSSSELLPLPSDNSLILSISSWILFASTVRSNWHDLLFKSS
jgi:hypothetical protein